MLVAFPSPASAKSERTYSYPFERVWPALLRFLRVDEQTKITERDEAAGYVLFELVQDGKTWNGAAELVRVEDDERRPATKIVLRVSNRPTYMEEGLLERFNRKLHEELGDPPDPPPPPKPPAEPDRPEDKPKNPPETDGT